MLCCVYLFRGDLACNIALDAVQTVVRDQGDRKEIDIKNYAKVEKVGTVHYFVIFQKACPLELFLECYCALRES